MNNYLASGQTGGEVEAKKSFYDRIYEATLKIPCGKVATYGQIAAAAGNFRAARAVGNALHKNPAFGVIPCHRVVNSKGRLAPGFAFGGSEKQKELLNAEGVEVVGEYVDLKKYLCDLSELEG
ncbi:MAG: MGMT family protein [Ruminococcus sp.]|nr:MGMT family protein [Ruminococcus sp.]